MNATVPRRTGALVRFTFGSRRTAASGEAGGASASIDFSRAVGGERSQRAARASTPARAPAGAPGA